MKIYSNINLDKKHQNSVIAIGNFDGLHLGHQKVINEAKKKAKKNKLPFGIMTFEPVPVMFFNSNIKNHRINSLKQKKSQLKKLDLDFLIIIRFNKKFSNLSAEKFIIKIINNKTKCRFLYVSKNFKFGKKLQFLIFSIWFGGSTPFWNWQHNYHHASVQNVKFDKDLQTMPFIAFHKYFLKNKKPNIFIKWQYITFYILVNCFYSML